MLPINNRELQEALRAAYIAGKEAKLFFAGKYAVEIKSDGSPVTTADKKVEEILIDILSRKFPDIGFLSEESGKSGSQDRRWIIDPIDGTGYFIHKIKSWAILIALEEAGEVQMGLIYNPMTGDEYCAQRGAGAFRNYSPIRVSDTKFLQDAYISVGGLKHLVASRRWSGVSRIIDKSQAQVGFGGNVGFQMVADGRLDLHIAGTESIWDIAAPSVIVEEAGGCFSDFNGERNLNADRIFVSNARLKDEILEKINLPDYSY